MSSLFSWGKMVDEATFLEISAQSVNLLYYQCSYYPYSARLSLKGQCLGEDFVGVFDKGVFTQGKENNTPYPMNRIGDYVCFH